MTNYQRNKKYLNSLWLGLSLIAVSISGCKESGQTSAAKPETLRVDASTLTGKVMCGYQGWFGTPSDGEARGWRHYRNQTTEQFKPGEAGIEFWPDMRELGEHERFDTSFRHPDGRVAQVFSSAKRDTVLRHFKWMQEYGIDGVFVQRFATEVTEPKARQKTPVVHTVNRILNNCRAGARQHGRTYAVMYDLTSMKAERISLVKDDWRSLVRELGILKDKSYQHHLGRPVVSVWGVGFSKGRDYGVKEVADLIDFFKNDSECGGLTVMLGMPTHWRDGIKDAGPFADWETVYRAADIISPWMVGRYGNAKQARNYVATKAKADRDWCQTHGKEFMPVVFPGFGWSNLKKDTDEHPDAYIDRDGGRFLWAQYDAHIREGGATMIYQAMFDELDEGTHIFKSTNDPPVGKSSFRTYGDLPSDHYLWLVGEATKRLRGELPSRPEMPARHPSNKK